MLLAQFNSHSAPSSSTVFPSIPSNQNSTSTSTSSSSIHPSPWNHFKSNKFTEKIFTHGGVYRDTTLTASTKAKEREKISFEKKFQKSEKPLTEFDEELKKIEAIRSQIIAKQQMMARKALEWTSAITIQNAWKTSHSKWSLYLLKEVRLLVQWMKFRIYYRKRVKNSRRISQWYRQIKWRSRFIIIIKEGHCSKLIQRQWKRYRERSFMKAALILLHQVKTTKDHILLFGRLRAAKYFHNRYQETLANRVIVNKIHKFLLACIRRRRFRILKTTSHGKLVFYILSQCYTEKHLKGRIELNPIIEYIRRKVEAKQAKESKEKSPRNSPFRSPRRSILKISNPKISPMNNKNTGFVTIDDMPSILRNAYAPKSIAEAFELIHDLLEIALNQPSVLDDTILPSKVCTPIGQNLNRITAIVSPSSSVAPTPALVKNIKRLKRGTTAKMSDGLNESSSKSSLQSIKQSLMSFKPKVTSSSQSNAINRPDSSSRKAGLISRTSSIEEDPRIPQRPTRIGSISRVSSTEEEPRGALKVLVPSAPSRPREASKHQRPNNFKMSPKMNHGLSVSSDDAIPSKELIPEGFSRSSIDFSDLKTISTDLSPSQKKQSPKHHTPKNSFPSTLKPSPLNLKTLSQEFDKMTHDELKSTLNFSESEDEDENNYDEDEEGESPFKQMGLVRSSSGSSSGSSLSLEIPDDQMNALLIGTEFDPAFYSSMDSYDIRASKSSRIGSITATYKPSFTLS